MNTAVLNIFRNFIEKLIICNGKNPPWVNCESELLITSNNSTFQATKRRFPLFSLREKYPNTDQKKLRILTISTQCLIKLSEYFTNTKMRLKFANHRLRTVILKYSYTAPISYWSMLKLIKALREKSWTLLESTDFFLVRIFPFWTLFAQWKLHYYHHVW